MEKEFILRHPDFDAELMEKAINLASDNVAAGGGPFGAVIARGNEIIACGVNSVTRNCDPTAHAEVSAIRQACAKEKTFKLSGCVIYSSCEPCPMCLSAIYWAGIDKIYYGNTKEDAAAIDFSDAFIYEELAIDRELRHLPCIHVPDTTAIRSFQLWKENPNRIEY